MFAQLVRENCVKLRLYSMPTLLSVLITHAVNLNSYESAHSDYQDGGRTWRPRPVAGRLHPFYFNEKMSRVTLSLRGNARERATFPHELQYFNFKYISSRSNDSNRNVACYYSFISCTGLSWLFFLSYSTSHVHIRLKWPFYGFHFVYNIPLSVDHFPIFRSNIFFRCHIPISLLKLHPANSIFFLLFIFVNYYFNSLLFSGKQSSVVQNWIR